MPLTSFKLSFSAGINVRPSFTTSLRREQITASSSTPSGQVRVIRSTRSAIIDVVEMAPKVFLTGVTGYVGGQVFVDLYKAHPDWDYTLIVRNEDRGKSVAEKYPKVRLVYGTNESADVIEKEAAAADIVIHTAESADDVPSAKAIAKGLAAGHTAENPGFWIHLSGTGILTWYDNGNKRFGEAPLPEQEYNDIQGIDKIINLPDSAMHRNVDKIVLAANSDAVRTAIVAPPTIYGPGQGPVNTRSQQLPNLAKFTLEKGYAPVVGAGLTEWDNVHVRDLGPLWVALADATQNPVKNADPEILGPRAYYFARAAVHRWADLAKGVAEIAHKRGYLPAPLTKSVQIKEVADGSLGANSKGVPERAAKYLGWAPKEPAIGEFFGVAVDVEADRLQLVPHEQAKA